MRRNSFTPGEQIEPKVVRQVGRLLSPALTDLKAERAEWAGAAVISMPTKVPPVFAGGRLLVYAFPRSTRPTAVRLGATAASGPLAAVTIVATVAISDKPAGVNSYTSRLTAGFGTNLLLNPRLIRSCASPCSSIPRWPNHRVVPLSYAVTIPTPNWHYRPRSRREPKYSRQPLRRSLRAPAVRA